MGTLDVGKGVGYARAEHSTDDETLPFASRGTSKYAAKDSVTIESPGGGSQLPFRDAGGKPLADKEGEVTLEPNRLAT